MLVECDGEKEATLLHGNSAILTVHTTPHYFLVLVVEPSCRAGETVCVCVCSLVCVSLSLGDYLSRPFETDLESFLCPVFETIDPPLDSLIKAYNFNML